MKFSELMKNKEDVEDVEFTDIDHVFVRKKKFNYKNYFIIFNLIIICFFLVILCVFVLGEVFSKNIKNNSKNFVNQTDVLKPTKIQALSEIFDPAPRGEKIKTDIYESTDVWFDYFFKHQGLDHYVVFIKTITKENECRTCGPMLGAITYRLQEGLWVVVGKQFKAFKGHGSYGDVVSDDHKKISVISLSDKITAFSINYQEVSRGLYSTGKFLYSFDGNLWSNFGYIEETMNNSGIFCFPVVRSDFCGSYEGKFHLSNSYFNGVKEIVVSGVEVLLYENGEKFVDHNSIKYYRFNGIVYEKVIEVYKLKENVMMGK